MIECRIPVVKHFSAYILMASLFLFAKVGFAQEFHVGDTSGFNTTHVILDDTLKLFLNGTVAYELDIDQDDEQDIRFTIKIVIGALSVHMWQMVESLNSIEFACDTSNFNADTLIYMSVINNDLNWISRSGGLRLYEEFSSQAPPPWGPPSYKKGLFRNADQYLGFRKISNVDTLYGWINLDCSVTDLIFKDYAINSNTFDITDLTKSQQISIYPNPCTGILHLEFSGIAAQDIKVNIINGSGVVIKSFTYTDGFGGSDSFLINLGDIPAGLYLLKYEMNGKTVVRKVIKQ
jgi:hypothetical protein